MKKLFLLCTAFVMAMNFMSCGNDNEPGGGDEGGDDTKHTYIMTYNLWMPTDFLKFVDVEITFFNPVTEKTATYAIGSNDENMFGAEGNELVDGYLKYVAPLKEFSTDSDFLYYYIVDEVEEGMEYKATLSYTVNEEKVAALPDGVYDMAQPKVFTHVVDEKGNIKGKTNFTYTKLPTSKEKAVEYFRKHQSDEPKTFTGTIEISSKNNNK